VSPRDYASVPERIAWTTGFRIPIDKHVLCALSTFGNFKTGEQARPSVDALVNRSGLERRRVLRSLRRLEQDGWIKAARRHRHATTYRICVERLATNWVGAKVITNLGDTGDTQNWQPENILGDTGDRLGVTGVTQNPDLSVTGVTPIPGTYDPRFDPRSPYGADAPDGREPGKAPDGQEGESAGDDLSRIPATLRDRPAGVDGEPDDLRRRAEGADQASPSDTGLPLRQQPDPESDGPSRTRDRPHYQPTLGPLDVSVSPETQQRQQHWTRVGEIFKEAMTKQRKVK
jgi:hypothetical protein